MTVAICYQLAAPGRGAGAAHVSNYRRGILAALLLLNAGVAYAAPGITGMTHLRAGIASWYGPHFEGKPMANGCVFHQANLSAASRTLPLGSWIRVKRLHSERSVVLEVTDRGPYVGGRVLDLSRGAAEALDMIAEGLVMVSIEPIGPGLPVGVRRECSHLRTPALG